MANICEICGKGAQIGRNVSYSKRRTRRVFLPNLRWAKLNLGGKVKKVKICMKCLKKIKKVAKAGKELKEAPASVPPSDGTPARRGRGRPKKVREQI